MSIIKKIKKYSYVEVFWIDSTHESGWKREEEFEKEGLIEYKTIGVYIGDTKRTIKVVQSICNGTSQKDNYLVDNFIQIPKVAILKIKNIK